MIEKHITVFWSDPLYELITLNFEVFQVANKQCQKIAERDAKLSHFKTVSDHASALATGCVFGGLVCYWFSSKLWILAVGWAMWLLSMGVAIYFKIKSKKTKNFYDDYILHLEDVVTDTYGHWPKVL